MKQSPHDRAEVLAGAIALGEATDEERIEYRRHLAECVACLRANGGELELERLTSHVKDAHASEIWDPDVRGPLMDRVNTGPRRIARYGFGFLGVALVISLVGHFVIGSSFPTRSAAVDPLVLNYDGTKITLERRSVRDTKTPAPVRYNIVHNIVVLSRTEGPAKNVQIRPQSSKTIVSAPRQVAQAPSSNSNVARSAQAAGAQRQQSASARPPWQVAPHRVAIAHNPAVLGPGANAESISLNSTYTTREPMPDAGETAIKPEPALIAEQEGAEGTTAFEVMIDESGAPTKCVITKSSGWPVLDEAACAAAMKVHYRPKTVNGHAVPGIYRDAFTFRASQASQE